MKNHILTVAVATLLFTPFNIQAEEQPGGPGGPGGERKRHEGGQGGGGREHMDPAARLKAMTEKLGLTPDQQAKIKAIFEKNEASFKELKAKGRENATEEEKTKFRETMKAQREEIDAILTPEQKEKMKAEREKRREGGQGGPGGEGKRGDRGGKPGGKPGESAPL